MKNILPIIFILLTVSISRAQCDCGTGVVSLNASDSASSYTFLANTTYCITGNFTIQWTGSTFQDNVTLCLANGATFKTSQIINTSANAHVTIKVGQNATLIVPTIVPASFDVTIENGGTMQPLYSGLTINGTDFALTVENGGTFDHNGVTINSTGSIDILNSGTIDANNIYLPNYNSLSIVNNGNINLSNVTLNGSGTIDITNNGSFTTGNFTVKNASTFNFINTSVINTSLFTLKTGVTTFNMTNNTDSKWLLSSHIHLDSASSTFLNNGEIAISGEIQLDNGATLNMTNSGEVTTTGNFNWGESGLSNYLYNMGVIDVGGQMSSEDCLLEFINYSGATLTMNNHLTYGTNGPNKFENYGTFHADGLYSNDPTLHMKNEGDMTLESNYSDTSESIFSNCGTLNMENWFDLNGKIINTGTYNVPNGSIGFSLTTSSIENYSEMLISNIVMGSNGIFYNEGEVTFSNAPNTSIRFSGPESTYQPAHSTSTAYGRFMWPGSQSNQSGFAVGNLNFVTTTPATVDDTSYPGMFGQWTSVTFGSDVVFGSCPSCVVVTDYDQCANADGTWPETIINCIPVNRHIRSFLKGS
ncbi:hypothetical protein NBRC110019_26810 [Neptunitalea chrysea]|uniref:G8 domain-containing protein n=1 Tax=Neptunitalea chrysea TaxID=1647581 RepID=A0A9W6B8F2_9FLAO|nr:hypothetical protein [Neptunitalea chrysea]GLB53640.1 hypothetical protein NBRC110019_26810 [Neptunitalea chrysea]